MTLLTYIVWILYTHHDHTIYTHDYEDKGEICGSSEELRFIFMFIRNMME